jgi:indole-3-glycerol phosphate synthase
VGPSHILVSESGIYTGTDTKRIRAWGADAILVGEALMRATDKAAKMAELKGSGDE